MDNESYDQLTVPPTLAGRRRPATSSTGPPSCCRCTATRSSAPTSPPRSSSTVTETEPGVQGDRVSGRPQAGHARDRARRAGAAVREPRRPHQGRHPLGRVHHPRLMASLATERRAARERALGLLYEAETKGVARRRRPGRAARSRPDEFAAALVQAVDEHRDAHRRAARAASPRAGRSRAWPPSTGPRCAWAPPSCSPAPTCPRRWCCPRRWTWPPASPPTARAASSTASSPASPARSARTTGDGANRSRTRRRSRAPTTERRGRLRPRAVDGVIIDLDGVIRHWDPSHLPGRRGAPRVCRSAPSPAVAFDGGPPGPGHGRAAPVRRVVRRDRRRGRRRPTAWTPRRWPRPWPTPAGTSTSTVVDLVADGRAGRCRWPSCPTPPRTARATSSGPGSPTPSTPSSAPPTSARPSRPRPRSWRPPTRHRRAARPLPLRRRHGRSREAARGPGHAGRGLHRRRRPARGCSSELGLRAVTPPCAAVPDPPLSDGDLLLRPWRSTTPRPRRGVGRPRGGPLDGRAPRPRRGRRPALDRGRRPAPRGQRALARPRRRRRTAQVVGEVGLARLDRWPARAEIGWWLGRRPPRPAATPSGPSGSLADWAVEELLRGGPRRPLPPGQPRLGRRGRAGRLRRATRGGRRHASSGGIRASGSTWYPAA